MYRQFKKRGLVAVAKIYIKAEEDRDLANELLLSAYSYCIIANSINPLLVNHGEVLVEKAVVC